MDMVHATHAIRQGLSLDYWEYLSEKAEQHDLSGFARSFEKKNGYPLQLCPDDPHYMGRYDNVYKAWYVRRGRVARLKQGRLRGYLGGERKKVSSFSEKSRVRMRDTLASIEWEKWEKEHLYSITLTYGSNAPTDGHELKRQLKALWSALDRKLNKEYWAVWKLEFQENGNPHIHILLYAPTAGNLGCYLIKRTGPEVTRADGTKYNIMGYQGQLRIKFPGRKKAHYVTIASRDVYLDFGFRQWLQNAWVRINDGDTENFNAGVEVDKIRGRKTALPHYFIKYLEGDKGYQETVPENYSNVGRFWGVRNRKKVIPPERRQEIDFDFARYLNLFIRKIWKEKELPSYRVGFIDCVYYATEPGEIECYLEQEIKRDKERLSKWDRTEILLN